jgi:hypothetical protein
MILENNMANITDFVGNAEGFVLEEINSVTDEERVIFRRILSTQVRKQMKSLKVTKTVMARKLSISPSTLNRLLDLNQKMVNDQTLKKVAHVIDEGIFLYLEGECFPLYHIYCPEFVTPSIQVAIVVEIHAC